MKVIRRAAIVLATAFATAASAGNEIVLDIRGGVVFPADRARDLAEPCSRAGPSDIQGTWLPSREQIRDLEAALPAAFDAEIARRHIDTPLDGMDYERQYGGLILGGRKIIYVNAFPARWYIHHAGDKTGLFDDRKKMQLVRMCDGGPRYFGVEYDPIRKTFSHFEFDGYLR